jgi:hypothetical protein
MQKQDEQSTLANIQDEKISEHPISSADKTSYFERGRRGNHHPKTRKAERQSRKYHEKYSMEVWCDSNSQVESWTTCQGLAKVYSGSIVTYNFQYIMYT